MKAAYFIAKNMCCNCCPSCCNGSCELYGSNKKCWKCLNLDCINNLNSDKGCDGDCLGCLNKKCFGHKRFNVVENLLKHC